MNMTIEDLESLSGSLETIDEFNSLYIKLLAAAGVTDDKQEMAKLRVILHRDEIF
jgi:hypothetical protein